MNHKVAVIIPCFRVTRSILAVVQQMGSESDLIIVVDDCCPDASGNLVLNSCNDPRVQVIQHQKNLGVGGATLTGYRAAMDQGADILVKVDGDGQMNPSLIPEFLNDLITRNADYVKGNRFERPDDANNMPLLRLFGNRMLSLITKVSSGYWHVMDPTNGFTAIRAEVARKLPFDKIDKGYFFESDLLMHLNLVSAVVVETPMRAIYGDETSNLKIGRISIEFLVKNLRNTFTRLWHLKNSHEPDHPPT